MAFSDSPVVSMVGKQGGISTHRQHGNSMEVVLGTEGSERSSVLS